MSTLTKLESYIHQGHEILGRAEKSFAGLIAGKSAADYQYWETRLFTFLRTFLPVASPFMSRANDAAANAHRRGGIEPQGVQILLAHLQAVHDAIAAGEAQRVEQRISADDFNEFLDFAVAFCRQGKKERAAIIASAVFEGALRRVGSLHDVERGQKLELIINALKSRGAISKLTSKKLKASADVRTAAFHASYEEFTLADVEQLIAVTSDTLERLRTQT